MAKITFRHSDGEVTIDCETDRSLMEAAVDQDVPGIVAACGGMCSCGTCHVKIDPEWTEKVGPPNTAEKELLEASEQTEERSRLSCQVELTEELDGLVVDVPDEQP